MIRSLDINLVSQVLNWDVFKNLKQNFFGIFKNIFKSVKSPASWKENVRFLDSPDFEKLSVFQTGHDVRYSHTQEPRTWCTRELSFAKFKACKSITSFLTSALAIFLQRIK